jgi:3-hydroxyisobutyrate dehydrogenase-like beta-hydroxyacid dehydrogenase
MDVGVIGLGMMGSQIALRLSLKGHKITVFNRDRSKAEKLVATGTTNLKIADRPKEIGNNSDIVVICCCCCAQKALEILSNYNGTVTLLCHCLNENLCHRSIVKQMIEDAK